MGCNVRDKSLRAARNKHRHSTTTTPNPPPIPIPPIPTLPDFSTCSESQLESLLLKHLDLLYRSALTRLTSLGFPEPLAFSSLLSNGHLLGPDSDPLSNILHNSLSHLNSTKDNNSTTTTTTTPPLFTDLRHAMSAAVGHLVGLVQQGRPGLSRGDAMWCLLMADLNLGKAREVAVPKRRDGGGGDMVGSVVSKLGSLSLEEGKQQMQGQQQQGKERLQELEKQVQDQKEWAQQKAIQSARRLSNDLAELKKLRLEREQNAKAKKGKQALEETTMKRLSDMEGELKKASGGVDRANAAVRRLENENAEIRAEMEASKLSASESVTECLEVARREKKCLKRLLAWEKQREKMQEEVKEERRRIAEMEKQLAEVTKAQKEAEIKWRREIKAKEQAITQVEEERRAKEAADVNIKRRHEALRRNIELDFQRHKDDIQRLEDELSRLKASAGLNLSSNTVGLKDAETPKPAKDTNTKKVQGFNKVPHEASRKVNRNRQCVVCKKEEVSVVFLPCAHQVLCFSCSEDHERRAKTCCPCCGVQIEQRIRVFGASF